MMTFVRSARVLDKGHAAFVNRLAETSETKNTIRDSTARLHGCGNNCGVEISARDRALIFLERAGNVVAYTAQRIGRGPDFSHHVVGSLSAPRHAFGDRRTQLQLGLRKRRRR
jgi:hypothetical protein